MQHPTGWTGGQYSVWRVGVAAYLVVIWARLCNAGWPFVLIGIAASFPLALGVKDRGFAMLIAACWLGVVRDVSRMQFGIVLALLVLHMLTKPAPYGALAARGREDPAGTWFMPRGVYLCGWGAVACVYLHGLLQTSLIAQPFLREMQTQLFVKGVQVVVLSAMVAAVWLSALRRWVWCAAIGTTLMLANIECWSVTQTGGVILLHVLTFDPAWIPALRAPHAPVYCFYDGDCGLCHRAVRFVLAEDRQGKASVFAPLQGQTFAEHAKSFSSELPDSILVYRGTGPLLMRSAAIIELMERLGGLWRVCAWVLKLIPQRVRDFLYDGVAKVRYLIFSKPTGFCPVVPQHLRVRFLP